MLIVTPMEWFSCVLFFRNYLPVDWIKRGWGGYTIHYWSLAVEEHFYLLWPALLGFSGRMRARYAAAGLAVAIAVWRSLDLRYQWLRIPGTLYYSRTDVRLDGLLLGCLAALIVAEPAWRTQIERLFSPAVWWAGAAGYILTQAIWRTHTYSLLESILLAALVAGTVLRPHSLVGRILENPMSKWLGRLSYSLYLWQQLFLVAGASYPFSLLQRFPANLAMVFGAAWLSYELIERPMIRFGHRLAPPPTPGRDDLNEKTRPSAHEQEQAPGEAA